MALSRPEGGSGPAVTVSQAGPQQASGQGSLLAPDSPPPHGHQKQRLSSHPYPPVASQAQTRTGGERADGEDGAGRQGCHVVPFPPLPPPLPSAPPHPLLVRNGPLHILYSLQLFLFVELSRTATFHATPAARLPTRQLLPPPISRTRDCLTDRHRQISLSTEHSNNYSLLSPSSRFPRPPPSHDQAPPPAAIICVISACSTVLVLPRPAHSQPPQLTNSTAGALPRSSTEKSKPEKHHLAPHHLTPDAPRARAPPRVADSLHCVISSTTSTIPTPTLPTSRQPLKTSSPCCPQ